MQHMTRPFNPSSTQLATTTNKGAAATAHIRGVQTSLARELDSYCISCGYHWYLGVRYSGNNLFLSQINQSCTFYTINKSRKIFKVLRIYFSKKY